MASRDAAPKRRGRASGAPPRSMTSAPFPDSPLANRFVASPNYGERRGYGRPNSLILHYTGMPTGEAALKALTDPASEVSAHYLVWEDGSIDQLVAETHRAFNLSAARILGSLPTTTGGNRRTGTDTVTGSTVARGGKVHSLETRRGPFPRSLVSSNWPNTSTERFLGARRPHKL